MKNKVFLLAMAGFMFAVTPAFSQTAVSQQTEGGAATAEKVIKDDYVFYADNIVGYMKNYLGIDNIFEQYPAFPRFVDSGNRKADCDKYKALVMDWINSNDEFRRKYQINLPKQ